MAIGDGDADDGCRHRDKMCRRGSGDDGDDDGKRCRVAAGDRSDDCMEEDDDNDFYYASDDDDDYYFGEDDDAGGYPDEEPNPPDDGAAAAAGGKQRNKQPYAVLTEADIAARQQKDTADVAEVLSIPPCFAAVLLRHLKWRPSLVQEEWFADDARVRGTVGHDGVPVAMSLSRRRLACGICFDTFDAGETRSVGCCAHYYCDHCWRGYVHAAVADGARCLSLRCPDPSCAAAVVADLVDAVASAADRKKYARFALRSYVEESAGGAIKWCPAPGCTNAVEFVGGGGGGGDVAAAAAAAAADVWCGCGHGFCWGCGEEAHRPVGCGTVRAWAAKNSSESETANWVLAHTKHCPKCRRPIEKNQGCHHMTCRAPCHHQFCWLCFDPWDNHKRCSSYYADMRRGRQRRSEEEGNEEDAVAVAEAAGLRKEERRRRKQAKASLDRYLYHYERWAANGKSMHKAAEDMDGLRAAGLEQMAAALEIGVDDLGFLSDAYELVAEGRRVMRWVYAYGYYLDPDRDAAKRALFDHLLDDANAWLERLHGCAELERKRTFCVVGGGGGGDNGEGGSALNETYRAYKKKMQDLTKATRTYFGNLVKAFETDLPEFNSVK